MTPQARLLVACTLHTASALSTRIEGFVTLANGHRLWHRIVRPDLLLDPAAGAPLVCLHGGPQVPSDYLFDLENVDNTRAVVFYDQLGCGRSDRPPSDSGAFSVEASITNLRELLSAIGLDGWPHHLYGQSWGGLLAFFHLSDAASEDGDRTPPLTLTLTLSNTPTSVPLIEAEASRLLAEYDGAVDAFMAAHNYRGIEQPPQLAAAYAHAGTSWRGSSAINGLEASSKAMQTTACPSLVLRGEHDFCTSACVKGWQSLRDAEFVTLPEASHHALLETPETYLEVLRTFLAKHEEIMAVTRKLRAKFGEL